MSDSNRTEGEKLFERYLASQSLPFEFEKEQVGKSKRPDYSIVWNGKPVLLDVKDFDAPENVPRGFGAFDPYPRIREKIEQGREKFKQFKEVCCAVVLCNLGNCIPILMHASPPAIHGKSRMRKRACTDLCGGRSAMVVPTATVI
jgi:hypothetical protein